ncbi:hypothetical protein AB0P17_01455 [Streptomyces sp. NPDC088124]
MARRAGLIAAGRSVCLDAWARAITCSGADRAETHPDLPVGG